MNKKFFKKSIIMIAFAVVLFGSVKTDSCAASKAKVTYQKVDKSKTYKGTTNVKARIYYKKVVLKGSTKAVKKINNAITADCNKFLKSQSVQSLHEYAKEKAENGYYSSEKVVFYNYATSSVTYNKNGIISIKIKTHWFAGGVSNTDVYGLTYSLKTGKRLYLTDVCKGSASSVKKTVLNKVKKDLDSSSMYWNTLNKYKVKKMDFYLKPGKKAVVCFGPNEINYGGWYSSFTIASKYK